MYTSLIELQLLLLRIGPKKVCAIAAMAVRHGHGRRFLSMVLVGLLSSLFAQGWKVHWRPG